MNIYEIVKPYTMTNKERVSSLIEKVNHINFYNIEGNMVECGVWKCGMLGVMSIANRTSGIQRGIFGFDSFQGLPKSNIDIDGKESNGWEGKLAVSMTEAETNLLKMGCTDVQLFKGFFENSIPEKKSNLGKIAILRLDGDWYSSTMTCLNELYDLIMPGGFIIIDDYGHWQGCKTAVDKFRKNRNISGELFQTDYTEFWWVK
jgi:hypothetical protein